MTTTPNDRKDRGNAYIHVTTTEKGDTAWYAISALIVAVLVIVYLLLNLFGLIPDGSINAMVASDTVNIFSTAVFLIASALALIKAKNLKIIRGIRAFALSALFYFIAEIAWASYNFILHVDVPTPSGADIFYILGSVTFVVALVLMIKSLSANARIRPPLIFVTVIGAALLAGILYYLTYGLSPDSVGLSTVVDIAYPVFDLVSLIFVVMLMVVSEDRNVMQAQIIMVAGVLITSLSDIMFTFSDATGLYFSGSIMDFLFAGGYLLFGISVWRYVELTKRDLIDDRLSRFQKKAIAR